MYSRERTMASLHQEKVVATGMAISAEGLLLVSAMENGVEVVKPSEGIADEVVVGFSNATNLAMSQEVLVKQFTVPADAPYEVDLGEKMIVEDQVRVVDEAAAADLVAAAASPAGSGEFFVNLASGVVEFHADEAEKVVTIYFKHQLTVDQARLKYFEGFIGNDKAFAVYNRIGVLTGKGTIYTDQFDVSADYSGNPTLYTGADGMITTDNAGTEIVGLRVVAAPSLSGNAQFFNNVVHSGFLGVEFHI